MEDETFKELPNGVIQVNIQQIKSAAKNLLTMLPGTIGWIRTILETLEEIENYEKKP